MGNSASHSMFAEDNDGEETSSWGFPLDLILKAERLPTAMTLEEKAIYRQQGKNDRSSWFFSFFSFECVACIENDFDCGIACVHMIYKWAEESYLPTEDISRIKSPLWTIDLLEQLLLASNLDCHMYTLALGIHEYHDNIDWYEKYNNCDDKSRIQSLFKKSVENNWPVHERKVSMATIIDLLEKKCIMILLVNSMSLSVLSKPRSVRNDKYVGHFIVVTSYNKKFRKFLYLDPSRTTGWCFHTYIFICILFPF